MKTQADLLITKALIVTMNPNRDILPDSALAIRAGSILEVGDSESLSRRYEAREILDARGCLVMPGLINTHTHLATVALRGLAEDLPLGPWLKKVWEQERAMLSPAATAAASRLGMIESLMGGVTCAVDMYWFPMETAVAAKELGFRLVNGPVFIEGNSLPDGLSLAERELFARGFVERFSGDPLIRPMLMPHSTYTDSPELLSRVKRMANDYGLMVNLHTSETKAERDEVLARRGKTPIRWLDDLGYLDGKTLLAHCVHVDDEEIGILSGKAAVAHNPMSNLKLASGIAPLAKMMKAGVRLTVGTDGAQSGNDLDMWLALRLTAVLQKNAAGDTTLFKAREIVEMATIEAARAIGLDREIGSLEPGKKADVIVIDLNAPHLCPLHDVYAQLVYAVGREDVRGAIINGKTIMKNRTLTTANVAETMEEVRKISGASLP